MLHSWTMQLEKNGEDIFLPLPNEMLELLGWSEGTTIYFIDNKDGTFTLTDKEEDAIPN